jgi:predicted permease
MLGRDFSVAEDKDPSARVAILSHSLWRRQFAADREILNKTVQLNGGPYQVIGVMPPEEDNLQLDQVPPAFGDLQRVDLWTTLAPVADFIGSGSNIEVVARVRPTLTLSQASAEFASLTDSFRQDQLEGEGRQQALGLTSVQSVMSENVRTYLWILLAAVAFLLLIACANISNLLLARGTVRAKEVAIRTAMGSRRGELVRQFLVESLVLALAGGVAGILVARLILALLLRFAPQELPRVAEIHVDGWALLFAFAATLFSGLAAGMVPAFRATKADVSNVLKENVAQGGGSLRKSRLRSALVVSEIVLSLVLLIGACLLGETFLNLMRVDPGFRANGLFSAEIWLTGSRVKSSSDLNSFYQNLTTRLKQIPGIENAGIVSSGQPLERGGNVGATINGTEFGSVDFRVVTPEYFRALGTSMLQGRDFEALDTEKSEPVAIVNEAFVKQTLKNRDAFTSVVKLGDDSARRIVGVAANVKSFVGFPPDPTIFIPAMQTKIELILGFDVWFPTHILVPPCWPIPSRLPFARLTRAYQWDTYCRWSRFWRVRWRHSAS